VGALAQLPAFRELCRRLYEFATQDSPPDAGFYFVFRCLQGITGQHHSYKFHYDSHVVTALLPVVIPEESPKGDLLIIPRTRPLRRFFISNLVDKIIVGNTITQILLREASLRNRLGILSVKMQPGSVYFFNGYRSVHTSAACTPDKLRATALFHYGDPHENSRLSAVISGLTRVRRRNQ
jgi:hypothetical protein